MFVPRAAGYRRVVVRVVVLFSALSLLGAGCVRPPSVSPPPVPEAAPVATSSGSASAPALSPRTTVVRLASLPGAHAAFAVQLALPASWEVEVVPEIEAINLYDPAAPGATPREKSQIFLRHFRASDFLTLPTVAVVSRTPGVVAGRPAITYIIEKKAGVPPFPQQPAWRNGQHRVTDVRFSDQNPSEFLVFGKLPELPDSIFDRVLESLQLTTGKDTSLVPPAGDFFASVTKKPFGTFVTPERSPVQPERFRGYHTGADAELPAGTPVVAIADGRVLRSGRASGYGGLVVIEHTVAGQRVVSISGHLDPASLPAAGTAVVRSQRIGELGQQFSPETDGERAHLHFGIFVGAGVHIAGYVSSPEELTSWVDPITFLKRAGF